MNEIKDEAKQEGAAESEEPYEFALKKKLQNMREDIKTFDDLVEFLKYVKENCNSDYGGAPRAIAQAALATAWYLSSDFGITGFQASATMRDFIGDWMYPHNSCGLRILDYDDLLYPRYRYKFAGQTLSEYTWKALQEQAKKNIEKDDSETIWKANDSVREYWQSLADGTLPYGCTLEGDYTKEEEN